MPCLTAEAHINTIPLCPPGLMTQDTVHLISCQQMAGSLIVPITHRRQFQAGTVICAPDSRWGMRRCVSSWVKGKKQKALFSTPVGFSVKQIHHIATGMHRCVFSELQRVSPIAQGFSSLLTRRREVKKSNSEIKPGNPFCVEIKLQIHCKEDKIK